MIAALLADWWNSSLHNLLNDTDTLRSHFFWACKQIVPVLAPSHQIELHAIVTDGGT